MSVFSKEIVPNLDWRDHVAKAWWTFRIILAFAIIGGCILLITRERQLMSLNSMIYAVIIFFTLIRLPKKFKRRKVYKEAIQLMKEQRERGPSYVDEEARRYWESQEREQQTQQTQQQYQQSEQKSEEINFFASCQTREEIEETFRKLVKIYHPDQNTGNEELFKRIQAQYGEMILQDVRNNK